MKRILSLLLSLSLFLLASCRTQSQASAEPSPSPSEPAPTATEPAPTATEPSASPALNSEPLPSPEPTVDPAAGMEFLRDVLLDRCSEELEELGGYTVSMYKDSEDFSQRIEDAYGVPSELIVDGFVIDDTGDDPFVLVVLQMTDGPSAKEAMEIFGTYKSDMYLVDGVISEENLAVLDYIVSHYTNGHINEFFWFLICQNRFDVQSALASAINYKLLPALRSQEQQTPTPQPIKIADDVCFIDISSPELKGEPDPDHPGRAVYVQPNEEDMSLYDTSAILHAWTSGNPDQLSAYDRAIYDSAKEVLESILQDGMDDFSKEAAIYEWVVQNLEYDWSQTDIMEETPRESYTPYGGLVNHKAVCLGYATTFQLLAELAGLESITVTGAGGEGDGSGDHAWNQVCLNGQWYCLDPAWESSRRDGSSTNSREWRFFNTTSDYMARTQHTWDYDSVPEATSEDHGCP